jgi:predicted PurR-regulated permease PerM
VNDATPRPTVLVPLTALLLVVLYLVFLVFRPFLLDLTVAASVALLLAPLQRALARAFGGRGSLAAGLIVVLVTAVILVPVLGLAALVSNQAGAFFAWLRPHLQPEGLRRLWQETLPAQFPWLEQWARLNDADVAPLASGTLSRVASWSNDLLQGAVARMSTAVFEILLFLMMLFFLLRDGGRLRDALRRMSPLSDRQEDEILGQLDRTVKGVLLAMAVVPLVQGVVAVVGFWIFGVPSALLWGVAVVLAALIPLVGSPLGWVPAGVYLISSGATWPGVGLLLYGLLFISTIDNLVKPWLLRETAQIHPLLGFLSILGGVLAFGPLGLLVGPVILSLVLSGLRIYELRVHHPA